MREYGPGNPLVFNHIPKCAGTAVGSALQAALRPAVSARGVDLSLVGGYDDLAAVRPGAGAPFVVDPAQLPADAGYVAGHLAPGTTLARYPDADHITVLRVPQLRVLSQWLHSRSVSEFALRRWGPSADAFRVGRLPLRDYLGHAAIAPNVDNTITRFLTWPHPLCPRTGFIAEADDDALFAAAIARLDGFAWTNVVENSSFLAELAGWLGRDLVPQRSNERLSVPPRKRPDVRAELSGGTRELLDHRVRIDVRVWQHVAAGRVDEADPVRVLHRSIEAATARYEQMLRAPAGPLTLRRAVEAAYDVGVRLGPRRKAVTRWKAGVRS